MSNPSPCRSCERPDEDALFCPHCGQALPDIEEWTPTPKSESNFKFNTIPLIVGLVLVLCLLGVSLFQ